MGCCLLRRSVRLPALSHNAFMSLLFRLRTWAMSFVHRQRRGLWRVWQLRTRSVCLLLRVAIAVLCSAGCYAVLCSAGCYAVLCSAGCYAVLCPAGCYAVLCPAGCYAVLCSAGCYAARERDVCESCVRPAALRGPAQHHPPAVPTLPDDGEGQVTRQAKHRRPRQRYSSQLHRPRTC